MACSGDHHAERRVLFALPSEKADNAVGRTDNARIKLASASNARRFSVRYSWRS